MKNTSFTIFIPDEVHMLEFGAKLASVCGKTAVIFLCGDLGVGKTTLSRGFMRGLGYEGKVKSPTYTIVEPYDIEGRQVFHFDFYRLHDPAELEFIGIQDYFHANAICLVEWPEHGSGLLPPADLSCYIDSHLEGRQVRIEASSVRGNELLNQVIHMIGEYGK